MVECYIVEFDALDLNNIWTLIPKPMNCKPIVYKWLYKVKLKIDCPLDRYKNHVMAMGYKQKFDIYYLVTFPLKLRESFLLLLFSQIGC